MLARACRHNMHVSSAQIRWNRLHVYILAGEPSGDAIGASLMRTLKGKLKCSDENCSISSPVNSPPIQFSGVGGPRMLAEGLGARAEGSLFPMEELSVMGILDIVTSIPRILYRAKETANHIFQVQPDVIVTVDSKGFNFRVLQTVRKRLQGRNNEFGKTRPTMIHYVAPSYWAYRTGSKPEDLKSIFDVLLTILPFEKPNYFDAAQIPCHYVGHPAVEHMLELFDNTHAHNPEQVQAESPEEILSALRASVLSRRQDSQRLYATAASTETLERGRASDMIVLVCPGSRLQEVKRSLPLQLEAIKKFQSNCQIRHISVVVQTFPAETTKVGHYVKQFLNNIKPPKTGSLRVFLETNDTGKRNSFAAADLAIATSGTVVTELALVSVPTVVVYPGDKITAWLAKQIANVSFVSIPNIMANKELVREVLFEQCSAEACAQALAEANAFCQQSELDVVLKQLISVNKVRGRPQLPSEVAADVLLRLAKERGDVPPAAALLT